MRTKLLFAFLALVLSLTVARAEVYSGTCGSYLTWTLDTFTGLLKIEGSGRMRDYSYASFVPWYDYRSYIKNVDIANDVTSIGNYAFFGCSRLTSITIPDGVTSIESSAFYGCTSLPIIDNIRYADTYLIEAVDNKLSTYNIKEGTKFIGSEAFDYCSGLTSITIPNSVTSIGSRAFYKCSGLTSITIPNSVASIGSEAFEYCSGLTSVTIPNSVTSIGDAAFADCN